jgi:hypothetical protein
MLIRDVVVRGIVNGELDRVYRRWAAPRAKAGGRQRTPHGELAVLAVAPVALESLTEADAVASGHPDLASLREELDARTGTVFRIDLAFRGSDPRAALRRKRTVGADDLADLRARLARKDRGGAWTMDTLRIIEAQPGTLAADLATQLGQDKPTFKRRVRQLKELGLTESLSVGYRLSPRGRALLRAVALLLLVGLLGCPSGTVAPDPDPPVDPVDLGLDPTVPAAPGEARAGVVRQGAGEAALFGGLNAEGAAGDIKLYNDRIQVIIGSPRRSHGMVDVGGNLIDADLVRTDGTLGRDTLEDQYLAFALSRLFHGEEVTLVNDGSDGEAAVVRATGTDVVWDFMTGLFELPEPALGALGLHIEQEYSLAPDSWVVDLSTTLRNDGDTAVTLAPRDGMMSSGEDLWTWAPDRGLRGPSTGDLPAFGVTGHRGEATLALWPSTGTFSNAGLGALAGDLGISTLTYDEVTLQPGEELVLERHFGVAPDILTLEAARWRQQGRALQRVGGTVTEATGAAVSGVRVWFAAEGDEERVAGFAMTGRDGAWSAELPPGDWAVWAVAREFPEAVQLPAAAGRLGPFAAQGEKDRQYEALGGLGPAVPLPFASGRATAPPVSLAIGDEPVTLDLQIPPASGLHLAVRSAGGTPLPAVVDVRSVAVPPGALSPVLQDAFGVEGGGRAAWGWTADGELDVALIPGTYSVRVGHGWRHGQALQAEVVVTEGAVTPLSLTLDEQVPRDGWLSLDPHLHAAPSFDGTLSMEHRLVTCAATGLDLPVMTDHDRQVDYQPLSAAMGLDSRLTVLPGVEVTTVVRGHFNLYPVVPDPSQPNGGAEPWWITPRDTQDLFDRMRARAGEQALTQVNHPRTPGMFSVSQFDAAEGAPRAEAYWSWDFELFELLNAGVVDLPVVRADWFGMLDAGRRRVPMGSSDSHYSYIPCGWARTDVWLDTDSPVGVTSEQVREALLAGHVVVAGGTTLRASLDLGAGPILPGDETQGSAGALDITVMAPDWMEPGTLRVYRNGAPVFEEALSASQDGVWFDGEVPVEAEGEAWFAVEVQGEEPVAELWRGFVPYAMTNAFFVAAP